MANNVENARETEQITIRLPGKQIERLKREAGKNYRPISREVEWALDEAWGPEREAEAA